MSRIFCKPIILARCLEIGTWGRSMTMTTCPSAPHTKKVMWQQPCQRVGSIISVSYGCEVIIVDRILQLSHMYRMLLSNS